MTLQLFNSQTKQKAPFTPLKSGEVSLYVCGMTVYDYCHIGHARVMVAFDVLTRWLRASGYKVNYVRNITDIDDKIIKRAAENGEEIGTLTTRFIAAMHEDADKLGCARPDAEPKATKHIDSMLSMINTLIDKGHAYAAGGDVYFAVDSFADYGKLSNRSLADMMAGASERTNVETHKKHPFDFVLWKSAKAGEPSWNSPWGVGRPGWHIECSAMSTCCLGDTFDIHGGGHDLQFPHHENEIAQSEATTGKPYVNTWMHVGFVNVDGEKMSKSLGNFFTIRDILAKYAPETVRYLLIASHYRSPVNFSDKALDEAHAALSRLYTALKNAAGVDASSGGMIASFSDSFTAAMNDDLGTPDAIAVLFEVARELNSAVNNADETKAADLALTLKTLGEPLGILQTDPTAFLQAQVGECADDLTAEAIEALIEERNQAKLTKDYKRADEIRAELLERSVMLEDSPQGTTWRRD